MLIEKFLILISLNINNNKNIYEKIIPLEGDTSLTVGKGGRILKDYQSLKLVKFCENQ